MYKRGKGGSGTSPFQQFFIFTCRSHVDEFDPLLKNLPKNARDLPCGLRPATPEDFGSLPPERIDTANWITASEARIGQVSAIYGKPRRCIEWKEVVTIFDPSFGFIVQGSATRELSHIPSRLSGCRLLRSDFLWRGRLIGSVAVLRAIPGSAVEHGANFGRLGLRKLGPAGTRTPTIEVRIGNFSSSSDLQHTGWIQSW